MSFRLAVESTPVFREHFREGLQAVLARDRGRLRCSRPRRLRGSVNIEEALSSGQPDEPRWDYAIGIESLDNDTAIWLEVHPASSTRHVGEVLRKLGWLTTWVQRDAPALWQLPRRFVWLATGRVAFRSGSPHTYRVAQKGLLFRAGQLDLDLF